MYQDLFFYLCPSSIHNYYFFNLYFMQSGFFEGSLVGFPWLNEVYQAFVGDKLENSSVLQFRY